MVEVTVLSRPDCHLCDVVFGIARRLQAEIPFALTHVQVDAYPDLLAQFGDRVPIVLIDHEEAFCGLVHEHEMRRAIKRARWRKPISRILSRVRRGLTRG